MARFQVYGVRFFVSASVLVVRFRCLFVCSLVLRCPLLARCSFCVPAVGSLFVWLFAVGCPLLARCVCVCRCVPSLGSFFVVCARWWLVVRLVVRCWVPAVGSLVTAMSSKRSSDSQEGGPPEKRRGTEAMSEVGSRSGRRQVSLLASEPVRPKKTFTADVSLGPPSLGEVDKARPLPEGLAFNWGDFARRNISVTELRSLPDPRPDVRRLLKVAEAVDDGAGRIGGWLGRQSVYVVPAGIPCSVTFARSVDEVSYIDAAARVFFVEKSVDEYETPLNVVGGFHRFPFEYHRDAAGVKRWKAAAGARRTLNALLDERDWGLVCQRGTDATVYNHWATFVEGITVKDFPRVPELLARCDVSAGVVVPVPWVCRFFADLFDDGSDAALRQGAQRWLESEWALLAIEAYGYEMYERGTAWILSSDAISFFERFAKLFEPLGVGAISMMDDKFDWSLVVETMGRAADQAGIASRWSDYCTNRSFGFVGYDARSGEIREVGAAAAGGRRRPGADRGRPGRPVPSAGEFGVGALYRVLTVDELRLIEGLEEALGVDVSRRAEHERRVGDMLVDFVGVAARLRREKKTLSDRVVWLEREVDGRDAEVRRLQSQIRYASGAYRSDPYAVTDPYAQGGGRRYESYERQTERRPDPYERQDAYRQPDPYAEQGGYRQSGYQAAYEPADYRSADVRESDGRTEKQPVEGRVAEYRPTERTVVDAQPAVPSQPAVVEAVGGNRASGVVPSVAAGPRDVGEAPAGGGDTAGFRPTQRRYPILAGGARGGGAVRNGGANPRQGGKAAGFGTGLGDGH